MIDHIWLRVRDIQKSKVFYEKLLKPLGYKIVQDKSEQWLVWLAEYDEEWKRDFWIKQYTDLKEISSISCLAFKAENKEQVDRFYSNWIEAWWKDNGKPWFRWTYHTWYYAAYIIDFDWHNIEAIYDEL